ncbi:hypothetical protein BCR43DRAFT_494410 [Syncephalastrum racemosum]|uniref:Uncharacterized protein n=1 Tax=Syncephalastrum racemosum TaxID=13706 RepID=A0A1X2H827_SYNRA|nr:hypothetical protein BCR43DRAFT_494410 [Syncephalastrum racemosum]
MCSSSTTKMHHVYLSGCHSMMDGYMDGWMGREWVDEDTKTGYVCISQPPIHVPCIAYPCKPAFCLVLFSTAPSRSSINGHAAQCRLGAILLLAD